MVAFFFLWEKKAKEEEARLGEGVGERRGESGGGEPCPRPEPVPSREDASLATNGRRQHPPLEFIQPFTV
jgi:hypothetical protein